MAFRYEKGALRSAATDLDDLRRWVGDARAYASTWLPVDLVDRGLLNLVLGTHGSIESATSDLLRDLERLVGEVATAFRDTDRTYREVDTARARALDREAGALPAGELERSAAETDEVPDYYWTATGWTDASVRLTPPDDDPDLGGPEWVDALSPTGVVNSAVYGVTAFAAEIGLIDRPVDLIEELCTPISGDWNAFARAGDALRQLGYFLDDTRTCVRGTANALERAWEGNASDRARDHLYDLAADLDAAGDALAGAADAYRVAARAAQDYAEALQETVEVCLDTASAALVAATATAAASASGIGLPVALVTGAYGISKVRTVVTAVLLALDAYQAFAAVKENFDSAVGGFGIVDGRLSLPSIGEGDVPVVTA